MFDRDEASIHDEAHVRGEVSLANGSLSPVVLSGEDGGVVYATLDFLSRTWKLDDGSAIASDFSSVNVMAPRPSGDVLVEMKPDGTFSEVA